MKCVLVLLTRHWLCNRILAGPPIHKKFEVLEEGVKRCGLIFLSMLLLAGCETSSPHQTVAAGGGVQMDLYLTSKGVVAPPDDRAHVEIRNDLDRAVTLDFDGGRHYDLTVGDHRDASIDVEAGNYRIRASAPSFGSTQISGAMSQGTNYELRVVSRRNEPR